MKPRDLRIGNLVSLKGEVHTIIAIDGNLDCINDKIGMEVFTSLRTDKTKQEVVFIGNFLPITLTDEWLGKLGFRKFNDGLLHIQIDNLILLMEKDDTYYVPILVDENTDIDDGADEELVAAPDISGEVVLNGIESVHQLQNLFFAIFGEELKLK